MATTAGSPGIDQAMAAAFLAACPDAFIAVDTDFNVILWNAAAEHLLGWRADQVLGTPPPHLDPAQDAAIRDTLWEPDAEVFPELEYRVHADGHVVPVVVLSEATLRDAAGEIVGWGRFLRGVEGGELRLSLRNDLSVRFVEAVRVDEVRAALAFALERLLGIRRAAVLRPVDGVLRGHLGLGMPLEEAEAAVVDDPELVRRVTQDRIASSATVDGRPALLIPMGPRANGAALALLDVTAAVGGDAIHLVTALAGEAWAALRRVELVGELEAKVEILEEAHQRKADYVDGICHDLRSPLTSLLGFIRTLRRLDEDATGAERREYLAIMERQAMRLSGMIEDMLVGARLEAGRLEPDERAEIDLAELVADVLSVLPPDRRRRVTVAGRDGVRVRGDRRQLERVVQNLVDNALNHTPPTTSVEVTQSIDDRTAVLRVRDHGAGIPEEVRATLFTRYARGGPPATGSTGLGLYIVRGIVAAHGGTVTATSTPEDGACLEVRLPFS